MKKILSAIDKHLEEVLMAVSLLGVVIMMSVHVFFRYVVKAPLTWSEEATRYLFIWFVFLGISYGIENDTHIRVRCFNRFICAIKSQQDYISLWNMFMVLYL